MKRPILSTTVLFCTIMMCVTAYASDASFESIPVDNENIQQYRGKIGQWVSIDSKGHLLALINKYQTTMKEFEAVNVASFNRGFGFVPYGDAYMKELTAKGVSRASASSQKEGFSWPLGEIQYISSNFGMRWGIFHGGIDLPSPKGTPIVAVMDGRVLLVNDEGRRGFGRYICIEHRDNFISRYAHNSVNLVKQGDIVRKGQIIGYVGSTGRSSGAHVHFEILYKDIPLNPMDFLPVQDHLKEAHFIRNWK